MSIKCALFSILLAFMSLTLSAKTLLAQTSEGMPFHVNEIATGLGVPWGLAFLNEDVLLITERSGQLKQLSLSNKTLTSIGGIPKVLTSGQGGLLDIALSPDYPNDNWLYFTYSKEVNHYGETALARAKYTGGTSLSSWQDLFVSNTQSTTSRHFGSRITFDNLGHVFFTVGDRGNRDDAQDLDNHAGSVIRLKRDGTIPSDNPFIGKKGAKAEIWSYGHRNPQGLTFSTDKQALWLIEHGPRGGDEINLVEAGKNYGWPVISYGKEYWAPLAVGEGTHKKGMEQPVKYYVPSIAPGSLLFYSGKAFPKWKGNLFAGALKMTHLNRVSLSGTKATQEERLLGELNERIRCVVEGPNGWLYISTDSGKVLEISPSPARTGNHLNP